MKIEAGKKYVTRAGVIVGPMKAEGSFYIEETPGVKSISWGGIRDSWSRDGSVCMGHEADYPNEIVSEFVPSLKIEIGKTYKARNGLTIGPMIHSEGSIDSRAYPFSVSHSIPSHYGKAWREDGTFSPHREPNELDIVSEVTAPSQHSEIERLKAVIASQKEKLDRVQNIHANTIKTLRKARADVKKVNKALSDEQSRTRSLSVRFAEVVKAATDAADYAKGLERTAPKKKRAIDKVDVGNSVALNSSSLRNLIGSERDPRYLMTAFGWIASPQGRQYWSEKYHGRSPINAADILFFKALLDKHNSSK